MTTTYDLNAKRRFTTRSWLALGAAAAAVAVLLTFIAVACGSADQTPLAAATTPAPTASAEPAEPADEVSGGSGGGAGQGTGGVGGNPGGNHPGPNNPGDNNPGNPDPGDEDPGEDEPEGPIQVLPIPLTPTVEASVFNPKKVLSCWATGKITVSGFLLGPIDVHYQWVQVKQFGLGNEPLSEVKTITFEQAGEQHVQVTVPKSPGGPVVQLHIHGDKTIYSNPVLFEDCH